MKKIVFSVLLGLTLISAPSVNAAVCFVPKEGMSDQSVQQSEQMYSEEEGKHISVELATCAIDLVKGLSPGAIFSESCEDGFKSCKQVIKSQCKKDKYGIWNMTLCIPFAPLM